MKARWCYSFYILVGSINCVGLAIIVTGPSNQTICFGASSSFDCVISDSSTITWMINDQGLGVWRVPVPITMPLSPGAKSTLILPGDLLFSGVSVVCSYGQIYSTPAFLTIRGPSSPPILTSIPHNSTSTSLSWIFQSAVSSALNYQIFIRNKLEVVVYNETLSNTRMVYTIPDPCDIYNATITAIYGYPNLTCAQQSSVQLAGEVPSAPLVITKEFLECLLSVQDLVSVNISIMQPQQRVCSYNISWMSSGSQPNSYRAQKPIVSEKGQSIFTVFVPFNLLINLTVIASNSYGSNASSMIYNTYEIPDVNIYAASLPGSFRAICTFLSCSQSIGCLVFLNESYCTASNRYANSVWNITCPLPYNDSLPRPGVYSIKAYAVRSNGSIVDQSYMGQSKPLTIEVVTTSSEAPTKATTSQQANIPAIVISAIIIVSFIIFISVAVMICKLLYKTNHASWIPVKYLRSIEQNGDNVSEESETPTGITPKLNNTSALDQQTMDASTSPKTCLIPELDSALLPPKVVQPDDEDLNSVQDVDAERRKTTVESDVETVSDTSLMVVPSATANSNERGQPHDHSRQDLSAASAQKSVHTLLERAIGVNRKEIIHLKECAENGNDLELAKCLSESAANSQDEDGNTLLMIAAQNGHSRCVQLLLNTNANVNEKCVLADTALIKASSGGHVQCVKLLLNKGAEVDLQNGVGDTALMKASRGGHVKCVKILLDKDGDVNQRNGIGQTALIMSSIGRQSSHLKCATLLLDKGADVNNHDQNGLTALMEASFRGHFEYIQLLLRNNAIINHKDKTKESALMKASKKGHVKCVQLLLDKNADVNCYDQIGQTALMKASNEGHYEIASLLLDAGANVDFPDNETNTALMIAASRGQELLLQLLVEKSADVNRQDKVGNTALMRAAIGGNSKCMLRLLDTHVNADVRIMNQNGETCIHLAALNLDVTSLKQLLLSLGDKKNLKDKDGNTILHVVVNAGKKEVTACILENEFSDANALNKAEESPLMIASKVGHFDCVELLLKYHAKVNHQDQRGETALMKASSRGHIDCLNLLLDNYAKVDLQNQSGQTALMEASYEGHHDVVQLLLDRGANVDIMDQEGQTAKKIAYSRQDTILMQLLEKRGAEVNHQAKTNEQTTLLMLSSRNSHKVQITGLHHAASDGNALILNQHILSAEINKKDENGQTPLHIVAERGFTTCVSILLKSPIIDVNIQDQNGLTPLHLASRSGIAACLKRLLSHPGVDKMKLNKDGNLALHEAVLHCRCANLEAFKSDDFNLASLSRDKSTILHYASRNGWQHGVEYILNHSNIDVNSINEEGHTALHHAAKYGHTECANLLIQHLSDVNIQSKTGNTSLHRAVINRHVRIVETLLSHPDIAVDLPNNNGNTPLNDAAVNGFRDITAMLLQHSSDVNAANKNGHTALHHAAKGGYFDVAKELMGSRLINVNVSSKTNDTPLHDAIRIGHLEIVKLLLTDPNIELNWGNNDNKTAIDLAKDMKHEDIIAALNNFSQVDIQINLVKNSED